MQTYKTVQVSEDAWLAAKQRALDERVTLREVVERAVRQYVAVRLAGGLKEGVARVLVEAERNAPRLAREAAAWEAEALRELTYVKDDDPA